MISIKQTFNSSVDLTGNVDRRICGNCNRKDPDGFHLKLDSKAYFNIKICFEITVEFFVFLLHPALTVVWVIGLSEFGGAPNTEAAFDAEFKYREDVDRCRKGSANNDNIGYINFDFILINGNFAGDRDLDL